MYDYVFVTHLPSFYKINLYNEISKKLNIYVIFIASSSKIRTSDFTRGVRNFDNEVIYIGDYESRNVLRCSMKLINALKDISYTKLVVGGWDLIEFWICIIFSKKSKNCVVVESTSIESSLKGIRKVLKGLFLKKITLAFPSGKLHLDLIRKLGYTGDTIITKGVGVFLRKKYISYDREFDNKFLYIGRLSKEKNLFFLIDYFNKNPNLNLTIVGDGYQKHELQSMANSNIQFIDYIPNEEIYKIYLSHDIFILPSSSEPWGLVIDEALYFGLPVLVSDKVGCATELVESTFKNGVFSSNSMTSLDTVIKNISNNYDTYRENVKKINFEERDLKQVDAYVYGLSNCINKTHIRTSLDHDDPILFSIITVVYNDEKNIEETINSVLSQNYKQFEYIVVDGGSSDGTVDIIKRYSDRITHWISEPDNGIYDAMNKGIALATGDFICFMNSADIFYDNTILQRISTINHARSFGFIYGDSIVKYSNDFRRLSLSKPVREISKGMVCSHQSLFTNRSIMDKKKFSTNLKITSDFELFYTSYKEGEKSYKIKYPLSVITSGGLSDIKRILCYTEYYSIVRDNVPLSIKCYYFYQIVKSWLTLRIKSFLPNRLEEKILRFKYRNKNAK